MHLEDKPKNKDVLEDLYIEGQVVCGLSNGLLPTNDIMHRIYRAIIKPKVGNFDEIHGFLIDLLLLTHQMKGQGRRLDVMDFIWHEMWHVVVNKKNICFAPLIMRLISTVWASKFPMRVLEVMKTWLTIP